MLNRQFILRFLHKVGYRVELRVWLRTNPQAKLHRYITWSHGKTLERPSLRRGHAYRATSQSPENVICVQTIKLVKISEQAVQCHKPVDQSKRFDERKHVRLETCIVCYS